MIWGEAAIDAPGKVTREEVRRRGAEGRARRAAPIRPSTSSSRPARGRACCRGSSPTSKLIWTYFEAMVPERDAEVAAGRRLGRDRHRVRLVLSHTMGAEVTVVEVLPQILPVEDAEIAGLRAQALREAGHQDPDRRQGDEAREEGRQRHRDHRRRQGQAADDHRSSA